MRHIAIATSILVLAACGGDEEETSPQPTESTNPAAFDPGKAYEPQVNAAELTANLSHALFPAPVGASWVYEAQTPDGVERIEISVPAETKDVWGTTARVVRDTVYVDMEMVEDTWDWYGQDPKGNVWYLGEETYEYENGMVVCDCGAWESGVDGALPGVIMLATPKVGDVYRQEYLVGEAEDIAEIVSLNETVTVPAGTFEGCLKTKDSSALDPSAFAYKYYCPGIGITLEEEGDERVELLEYSGL